MINGMYILKQKLIPANKLYWLLYKKTMKLINNFLLH
jgi:hypothetical protein